MKRSRVGRRAWTALPGVAVLVLLALSGHAEAGMVSPCDSPGIFRGAAVNVVLLPYTYTGTGDRRRGEAARNVSFLMQFEMLANARYGSLGVPVLRGNPRECNADEVLRLIEQTGPPQPSGGVVVMWGRFFETKSVLYVQTYLRFFRAREDDRIPMQFEAEGESYRFVGRVPGGDVAFPPRAVSRNDLVDINARYAEDVVVRRQPSESAPAISMDLASFAEGDGIAFGVRAAGSGWMELVPYRGSSFQGGYVRVGGETSTLLKRFLPELFFVDALVGYLSYRASKEAGEIFDFQTPRAISDMIDRSMASYREQVVPEREPRAAALSHVIPAATALLGAAYGDVPLARAVQSAGDHTASAAALTPGNGAVLNLDAMTRIYQCCAVSLDTSHVLAIDRELSRALVVAPGSEEVVLNLQSFYRLLARRGDPGAPIPPGTAKRRLAALETLAGTR